MQRVHVCIGFDDAHVDEVLRDRSLMIEMRRDLYMDERTGDKAPGFAASLALVTSLLAMAAERSREWFRVQIQCRRHWIVTL